jgi:hypothetical protein
MSEASQRHSVAASISMSRFSVQVAALVMVRVLKADDPVVPGTILI